MMTFDGTPAISRRSLLGLSTGVALGGFLTAACGTGFESGQSSLPVSTEASGEASEYEVEGLCDPQFTALREMLQRNIAAGLEVGASLAMTVDGTPMVDVWGGHADGSRTAPWVRDTITNVWSCTKTVTALAGLIAVDRRLIELDAPVSRYWPEFGSNGKDSVLVKHLFSHSSGVSGWDAPFTVGDLADTKAATDRLASQETWWEPGSASGYHVVNFGHLIGELIRRTDGRGLGAFIRDEITDPLGADFSLGVPRSEYHRVSDVIPPLGEEEGYDQIDPESVMGRTYLGPPVFAADALTDEWRGSEIGGANGHTNARALARIQSILACGGEVDGIRLLSEETANKVFETQIEGDDLVLATHIRFGLGFGLPSPLSAARIPEGRIAFWSGYGGSQIVVDADRRMTFSYVMNKMQPDASLLGSDLGADYLAAAYVALDRK